jgi:hypothetical protein
MTRGEKAKATRSKRQTKPLSEESASEKLTKASLSSGFDRGEVASSLFVILPIFGRAKLAIELLIANDPVGHQYAESVLLDMENLEIENLYEECKIDGFIQEGTTWIT